MVDLKMEWIDHGIKYSANYPRVFDFTDEYEENNLPFKKYRIKNVSITLFENPSNTHFFANIKDCYDFLKKIMK